MSEILGRAAETAALEGVLAAVRDGRSGVLVLRGDAGIGKTALLDWAAARADAMRVARVVGVQAEMGMGFAGLHQLLVPFLHGMDGLPGPQRQALASAFGLVAGPAPDRFLVGLAALTLLTDAATAAPVLCLVDDAQWLDQVSVEVMGFIGRRLYADQVGLLFAVRDGEAKAPALAGLPELVLGGLPVASAGELLAAAAGSQVDARVSAQVAAGVGGNPLALVELAGELTAAELSGAVPLGWPLRFGGQLEELYRARVRALPADSQTLLLVAAADPAGDPALVQQAAGKLGVGPEAGEAPDTRRLVSWQPQVRFRHPLIRSAAFYAAPAEERRRAHAAPDPGTDPDRRAWHLSEAAAGPDERVAAELERSAGRAQARGGLAAAALFLERSVRLTSEPARQARRVLAAAQLSMQAGAFGKALELLATVQAGALDEFSQAQVGLMRGQIAFASTMGRHASSLLLAAARQFEPLDLDLARETYLTAWSAASIAGHLAGDGNLLDVSRAARALPAADPPRPVDLILDGLARMVTDGPVAAAPVLRQALEVFAAGDIAREAGLRWGHLAATVLWDEDAGRAIMVRQVTLARAVGALETLPADLNHLAVYESRRGDFPAAASLIAEADAASEVTGSRLGPYHKMRLAALAGDEAGFTALQAAALAMAEAEGQGLAATTAQWVAAILYNGLGRYPDAFAAARLAWSHGNWFGAMWGLPELIEAAARSGYPKVAADALDELAHTTQPGGTDFGLGLEARSRALVTEADAAEGHYREAVDRLGRTSIRPELARAHLLYGEWLRRQRRRRDARDQLSVAFSMFDSIGMAGFAARAQAELRATGERAQPRGPGLQRGLTPQEEQIARLVAEHLSNREIAARLFLSASTVEYHLGKVFRKLSVSSRTELARLLSSG